MNNITFWIKNKRNRKVLNFDAISVFVVKKDQISHFYTVFCVLILTVIQIKKAIAGFQPHLSPTRHSRLCCHRWPREHVKNWLTSAAERSGR